jgi:hypothetical protein
LAVGGWRESRRIVRAAERAFTNQVRDLPGPCSGPGFPSHERTTLRSVEYGCAEFPIRGLNSWWRTPISNVELSFLVWDSDFKCRPTTNSESRHRKSESDTTKSRWIPIFWCQIPIFWCQIPISWCQIPISWYRIPISIGSRFFGVGSRFLGIGSRFFGVGSRFLGVRSRFFGIGSRFFGVRSRFFGVRSRFLGVRSRFLGIGFRFLGIGFRFLVSSSDF